MDIKHRLLKVCNKMARTDVSPPVVASELATVIGLILHEDIKEDEHYRQQALDAMYDQMRSAAKTGRDDWK